MDELATEIRKRLDDYFVAFASQSAARVVAFYKPDAFITVHQLGADRSGKGGKGKDVTAWVGGVGGALIRGSLPAKLMMAVAFRRLAKQGYDHSVLKLHGVKRLSPDTAQARFDFDRVNRAGNVFESSSALYAFEKRASEWFITELWLFDEPPASLDLTGFA